MWTALFALGLLMNDYTCILRVFCARPLLSIALLYRGGFLLFRRAFLEFVGYLYHGILAFLEDYRLCMF